MSEPVLRFNRVTRHFVQGDNRLDVLRGADFAIAPGEVVALVGPSGAGKSTLLHAAGLLERPDGGEIRIAGKNCADLGDRERTRIRRDKIGFVYQFHHLLPEFTALENVRMPQRIAGINGRDAVERCRQLLIDFGLSDRLDHIPAKLSGGEQQRVAIARAVANGPNLLLADEPTGNLDEATAAAVFEELLQLSRQSDLAALIATHNLDLAGRMDRTLRLENGIIVEG